MRKHEVLHTHPPTSVGKLSSFAFDGLMLICVHHAGPGAGHGRRVLLQQATPGVAASGAGSSSGSSDLSSDNMGIIIGVVCGVLVVLAAAIWAFVLYEKHKNDTPEPEPAKRVDANKGVCVLLAHVLHVCVHEEGRGGGYACVCAIVVCVFAYACLLILPIPGTVLPIRYTPCIPGTVYRYGIHHVLPSIGQERGGGYERVPRLSGV